MSHYSLSQAGLYRATMEAMLYSPSSDPSSQNSKFKDEGLNNKKRSVSKLVEKFENNLNLEDTIASIVEEIEVAKEVVPTPKPRTKFSRDVEKEKFYDGIRATSSPIPRKITQEKRVEVVPELLESPILHHIVPHHERRANFGILDSQSDKVTYGIYKPKMVSEPQQSFKPKYPLHRYAGPVTPTTSVSTPGSTCSSGSSGSSSSSTSPSSLSSTTPSGSPNDMDIYLKLARAQLHEAFTKYFKWDTEALRTVSVHTASMRLNAFNRIPITQQCSNIAMMKRIYEKCRSGHATKEMDVLIVAIFHLLEDHVHEKKISIHEEYVVMKYSRKLMNC